MASYDVAMNVRQALDDVLWAHLRVLLLLFQRRRLAHGWAVQIDPIELKLKPPGSKLLKLRCDVLLSNFAFKFNLRRHSTVEEADLVREGMLEPWLKTYFQDTHPVGRCRLNV
jgi:hypothetical protein